MTTKLNVKVQLFRALPEMHGGAMLLVPQVLVDLHEAAT